MAREEKASDHTDIVHVGLDEVWHVDCRVPLAEMPANCVDLTLADPPYESHMHNAKAGARGRKLRSDGYVEMQMLDFASIEPIRAEVAREIVRVTSGWALIFCTPEGIAPWRDALEAAGAKYKRACFWAKPDCAPQFNGQGPAMGVEAFVAVWCGKGVARWNGGGRRNWFEYPCNPPERDGRHPTEKPVALLADLISLFSQPGAMVLDPFAGSGSTGVAALRTGRRFKLFEQARAYFEVAVQRCEWERAAASKLERAAGRARVQTPTQRKAAPVPLFDGGEQP